YNHLVTFLLGSEFAYQPEHERQSTAYGSTKQNHSHPFLKVRKSRGKPRGKVSEGHWFHSGPIKVQDLHLQSRLQPLQLLRPVPLQSVLQEPLLTPLPS
ncbi:mCG141047, partial [Mus musculus]